MKKIQTNWEQKSNQTIEEPKGVISKNNSIITSLTNQVGNGFQKIMDKRVEATEFIWNQTLKNKQNIPATVDLLYLILQKHELNNEFIDSGKDEVSSGLLEINIPEFMKHSSEIIDEVWKYRPFMSEYLCTLIFAFQAFIGRTVYLVDGYGNGDIKYWLEDNGVKQILQSSFSKEEILFLEKSKLQPYKKAISLFETKILNELKKLISSEEIMQNAIDQVNKYERINKNEIP